MSSQQDIQTDWLEIVLAADTPEQAATFEDAFWQTGALSVTLTSQNEDIILVEPNPGDMPQWAQAYVTGLYAQGTDAPEVLGFLKIVLGVEELPLSKSHQLTDRLWEKEWQQYFQPIRFGEKLWICPTEQRIPADAPADSQVIYLDPGLAFGTGTHPTTAMVLTWLANQDLTDKTAVDYGCGSGILGIAAVKRGARFCVLNDIDEKALVATRENIEKNAVTDDSCTVCLPPQTASELVASTTAPTADVVIANILLEPLLNLRDDLLALTKSNGTILLTGLLHEQVDTVLAHYGTRLISPAVTQSGDWSLIVATVA